MPMVRSVRIFTSSAAGSAACRSGSCALIESTVAMTFAPGWRCTSRMIAGRVFSHAPSFTFSAPATMSATLLRRTGAPLR
jgi:hypothetical protein